MINNKQLSVRYTATILTFTNSCSIISVCRRAFKTNTIISNAIFNPIDYPRASFCSTGRVVNITSVHGRMYCTYLGNYEVSKAALECIGDSLRMEMKKFGVQVVMIEPGMFGLLTSCLSDAVVSDVYCIIIKII